MTLEQRKQKQIEAVRALCETIDHFDVMQIAASLYRATWAPEEYAKQDQFVIVRRKQVKPDATELWKGVWSEYDKLVTQPQDVDPTAPKEN